MFNVDKRIDEQNVCAVCHSSYKTRVNLKKLKEVDANYLTTLQRIYKLYMENVPATNVEKVPLDFEELFDKGEKSERKRHIQRIIRTLYWYNKDMNRKTCRKLSYVLY